MSKQVKIVNSREEILIQLEIAETAREYLAKENMKLRDTQWSYNQLSNENKRLKGIIEGLTSELKYQTKRNYEIDFINQREKAVSLAINLNKEEQTSENYRRENEELRTKMSKMKKRIKSLKEGVVLEIPPQSN